MDQLDPRTATLMEEVCEPQGALGWKIFGHIPRDYLGQTMNFSSDRCIVIIYYLIL